MIQPLCKNISPKWVHLFPRMGWNFRTKIGNHQRTHLSTTDPEIGSNHSDMRNAKSFDPQPEGQPLRSSVDTGQQKNSITNLNHSRLQHWSRFWELQIYKRTKKPMVTGFFIPAPFPPTPSTTIGSGGPSSSYTWSLRPDQLQPRRIRFGCDQTDCVHTWSCPSPKSLALGFSCFHDSISPRYPGSIKSHTMNFRMTKSF